MTTPTPPSDLVEEMARAAANAMDVDPDVFIGMHGRHKWEKQWHPVGQACLAVVEKRIEELTEALEPFASFAEDNVDADGWSDFGLSTKNERIVDWFGPSDFRRAALPHVVLKGNSNG